ncbi:MAG: hypothetical protein QME63_00885 [Actinomycetota bacterium]|nr:hypothetical protein [Actinomycetota bacterium]
MDGYIDTHVHILPGLDDGPATLQEAVEMVRMAQRNGITKIIATPHHNEYYHPQVKEIMASLELLNAGLKKANIEFEVYLGNELRIDPGLPEKLKSGEVFPMAGSRFILLEFFFEGIPLYSEDVIFRLRVDGWKPILAHAERIYDIQRNPERLKRFIDMGCMVQINSNSLTGELGRASLDTAIYLLELRYVDIMASDAHSASNRIPDFTGALKKAAKIIGKEEAQKLVINNPSKIFEGKQVSEK